MEPRKFLQENPFFKLLSALMIGILAGLYVQQSLVVAISLGICSLFLFLCTHIFLRSIRYAGWSSYGALLTVVCLGNLLALRSKVENIPQHYLQKNISQHWVLMEVASFPETKEKSIKVLLKFCKYYQNSWQPTNGKLLTYLAIDSTSRQLHKGDLLFFKLTATDIPPPRNPGAFNFQQYCQRNGIFQSQYLPTRTYKVIPQKHVSLVETCQHYTKEIIKEKIPDPTLQSLASGIIIGLKTELDENIYAQFQHTGIIHILSVSGLHLGIVLLIFQFLFGLFPTKNKKAVFAQTVFILCIVWAFALITGFSAAVQRAAVMISIYLIGKTFNKKTSGLNLMFASAFILCCIKPSFIVDIGFQLSYLAIFGLIVFYQPFYRLLYCKNKWLDKLWQLSCASFAAQLATWPLILYHFGSFPVYFLLANPPAILLSFLILAGGIALFAIGWLPIIGNIIGSFIGFCCKCLLLITQFIDQLPYAHWENIYSTKWNLAINFLVIGMLAGIILFRLRIKWVALTVLFTILSFLHAHISLKTQQSAQRLIVYSIHKHVAVGFQDAGQLYLAADDSLLLQPSLLKYNVSSGLRSLGIKTMETVPIKGNRIAINGKSMLIWEKRMNYLTPIGSKKIDYIYLRKGVFLSVEQVKKHYQHATIILDAGISAFVTEKLTASLNAQNNPVVPLREKALIISNN
ncbi:MAG: ComEC family competence protein [Chitinophagales bacterium]|nr:ComEC family competence protein [Chitinophagales bacterium]